MYWHFSVTQVLDPTPTEAEVREDFKLHYFLSTPRSGRLLVRTLSLHFPFSPSLSTWQHSCALSRGTTFSGLSHRRLNGSGLLRILEPDCFLPETPKSVAPCTQFLPLLPPLAAGISCLCGRFSVFGFGRDT